MSEIRETIGLIKCPICGENAEVRKDKRGKFYYVSKAGKITPNLPDGQEWVLNHARFFSESEKQDFNSRSVEFGRRQAEQEKAENEGWSVL